MDEDEMDYMIELEMELEEEARGHEGPSPINPIHTTTTVYRTSSLPEAGVASSSSGACSSGSFFGLLPEQTSNVPTSSPNSTNRRPARRFRPMQPSSHSSNQMMNGSAHEGPAPPPPATSRGFGCGTSSDGRNGRGRGHGRGRGRGRGDSSSTATSSRRYKYLHITTHTHTHTHIYILPPA